MGAPSTLWMLMSSHARPWQMLAWNMVLPRHTLMTPSLPRGSACSAMPQVRPCCPLLPCAAAQCCDLLPIVAFCCCPLLPFAATHCCFWYITSEVCCRCLELSGSAAHCCRPASPLCASSLPQCWSLFADGSCLIANLHFLSATPGHSVLTCRSSVTIGCTQQS